MPEKITSDMLTEFGTTIQGFFKLFFPDGLTLEEMKNSKHRVLRTLYEHFKEGN